MSVIVITPPTFKSHKEISHIQRMFDLGMQTLHIRKPDASIHELKTYLERLTPNQCQRCVLHSPLNDLHKTYKLKGIHYREADRPDGLIKAPPGLTVSTSFHDINQLGVCMGELDYSFLSPIFNSISKPGYTSFVPDLADLQPYLATSRYPVVALGGVTPDVIPQLADAGFSGVALLGSIFSENEQGNDSDPVAAFEAAMEVASRIGWSTASPSEVNITSQGLSCNTN
jgi:thiamine-phosphate pyrophosphorylase